MGGWRASSIRVGSPPRGRRSCETPGAGGGRGNGSPSSHRCSGRGWTHGALATDPGVNRPPRWYPGVVVAAVLLVYANAFGNAFVWDDLHLIVDNPAIKSLRGLGTLWGADLYPQLGSHYYRPLQARDAIWSDYQLWALAPFGYHLTNTLLHAGVALLLYGSASSSGRAPRGAGRAHCCSQSIRSTPRRSTYIAGRSDPAVGAGAARRARVLPREAGGRGSRGGAPGRWRRSWRHCSRARPAVVLVPLLVLVDLAVSRRDGEPLRGSWRTPHRDALPALRGRVRALPRGAPRGGRNGQRGERARPGAPGVTPGHDARGHRALRGAAGRADPPAHGAHGRAGDLRGSSRPCSARRSSSSAAVALVVLCWRRAWPVSFGVAWFLIALGPASNLVPLTTFMAEHWLYVPSMGLFLLAGWARRSRDDPRPVARAPSPLWSGSCSSSTPGSRCAATSTGRTASRSTRRRSGYAPSSVRAWINLGEAYQRLGQLDRAEVAYRQALALDPGAWVPYNNLGSLYQDQGRPDLAEQAYRRAPRPRPRASAPRTTTSATSIAPSDVPEDAVAEFRRALALNPSDAAAHNNLGLALLDLGRPDAREGGVRGGDPDQSRLRRGAQQSRQHLLPPAAGWPRPPRSIARRCGSIRASRRRTTTSAASTSTWGSSTSPSRSIAARSTSTRDWTRSAATSRSSSMPERSPPVNS